jgi:hypothetical protein
MLLQSMLITLKSYRNHYQPSSEAHLPPFSLICLQVTQTIDLCFTYKMKLDFLCFRIQKSVPNGVRIDLFTI